MNLEFFKGISDYFQQLTGKRGVLICPKHRIGHTGKNVYSVIIDLYLYESTGEGKYFKRAKSRVERTLVKLIKDPDYGHWMFYPGRLTRWNMSNSVIDSGACTDVLSSFYLAYASDLRPDEREKIKETIFKNSDGYLNEAVIKKEITNQRLWGGTGLSRAYQIFHEEKWRQNLLKSIEKSLEEMWTDGTFPYHPSWEKAGIFKGIYDTTTFYHSRCVAFIYYILENIGEDIGKYKEKLIKATDLLVAMYQPNGIKNIDLECKRWYWNSSYEIASAPFDVYTFLKSYELTGNVIYSYYAHKAFEQILKHQIKDGGIDSHLSQPRNNFQCRVFWNSNLAWLVRAMEKFSFPQFEKEAEEFQYFKDSGILKFKNENYCCILRAKKQPMSLMWGPAISGGSMLYFGTKKNNWENMLHLRPWEEGATANFVFYTRENYFKNLKKLIAENKREIKEKLFHAFTELRAPNFRAFFSLLLRLFQMLISGGKAVYASHWAQNADISREGDKITFELRPAKRNGEELKGVKIKREYIFGSDKIEVKESLLVENGEIGKIKKIRHNKFPNCENFESVSDIWNLKKRFTIEEA